MFGIVLALHRETESGPFKVGIGMQIPYGYKVKKLSEFRFTTRFPDVSVGTKVHNTVAEDGPYSRLLTIEPTEFDVCFQCEAFMESTDAL